MQEGDVEKISHSAHTRKREQIRSTCGGSTRYHLPARNKSNKKNQNSPYLNKKKDFPHSRHQVGTAGGIQSRSEVTR
jgi:hypothetical protein